MAISCDPGLPYIHIILQFLNLSGGKVWILHRIPMTEQPPSDGSTSRTLLVMKSGCAGGRGFAPPPGAIVGSVCHPASLETGKVFLL